MISKDNELLWEKYMESRNPSYYDSMKVTDDPYDPANPHDYEDDDSAYGLDGAEYGIDDLGEDSETVMMSIDPVDEVQPISDDFHSDEFDNGDNESDLDLAVYSDIKKLSEYSQRILDICKTCELEPWMQAQLVKASSYVSDVWHQLDAKADFANTGVEHSDTIEF